MAAIITSEEAAAEILARRNAEDYLHQFLRQAWPTMEGGRPFVDSWHIGAICEHVEALVRGEIKNLLINIPPRMTKSNTISVALPAWVWIKNPNMQWLFSSYAWTVAQRDSRRCRTLLDSKWFRVRWGDRFALLDDANRMDRYYNDKGGYRLTTSVDSATMGDGGDIQVADDANNTRDSSETCLQSVTDWWTNVMPTRINSFMTGRRLVIQQRTHERDLSGYITQNNDGSWVKLILPMEFEANRRCVTVALPSTKGAKWQDPRTQEGELLDPKRIDKPALARLKKDLGSEYAIAGQLQQRPAPEAGGIIRRSWFRIWQSNEPPQLDYILLSVDTALSEKKSAAYSAAITLGIFRDERDVPNVILMGMWRDRCEYPELRSRIQRLANNYLDDGPHPSNVKNPPDIVLIEAKVSGISLIQDLARAGVIATRFDPTRLGDKLQRVRMVTPILEAGRMWVPGMRPDFKRPRPFADIFGNDMAWFTNAEARDLVDCLTQGLWRLQQSGWVYHTDDAAARTPGYTSEQRRGAIY